MRFARTYVLAFFSVLALTFSLTPFALAQVPDPVVAAEAPRPGAGHHYIGIGSETVNPADGSLSFDLPLEPPAGRQISFTFGIRFAGTEQYFLKNWPTNGTLQWFSNGTYGSQPLQVGAWSYDVPLLAATTSVFWSETSPNNGCPNGVCTYGTNRCYGNDSYVFRGLDGNQYSAALGSVFPGYNNFTSGFCPGPPNNLKGPSNQHGVLAAYQSDSLTMVVDPSGTTYQFRAGSGQPQEPNTLGDPIMWGVLASTITDRNGNQLIQSGGGYKDPTGRTAISWSGIGSSNGDQINIAGLSGPVTVTWTTTPVSFPETGYNLDPTPSTCTLGGGVDTSEKVVSEIDLPNNQKYTFQYDGTYAKVSRITFPDGGYVRYVWGLYSSAKGTHASWNQSGNPLSCDFVFDIPAVTDRYVSFDGSTEVLHQQFSYALPNWSVVNGGPSWATKQTTVTSTDLLTGQVTKTIYRYAPIATDNNVWITSSLYSRLAPVETTALYQDGNGKTYTEVNKTWANPHLMTGEQIILYDTSGNRSVGSLKGYGYDSNEQLTGVGEYGFQTEGAYPGNCSGTSFNCSYIGPLRRQTATVYHPYFSWNSSTTPPSWTGTHIVNAPDSVTVADGTGTTVNQTLYTYDQNSLQASGAINLSNPGTTRANATTVQRLISGGTYATTTYNYYDTGQVYIMTDPCGNTTCGDVTGSNHTTTYSYADNYTSGTGTPTGQTFGYVTQITHPPTANANHTERFTWGYNDGLIRSHTDVENSLTASYAYADPLLRLTQTVAPDGGQTNISYNDTPPSPTVTTSKQINGSQTLTTVSLRDGMGHVKQTQLTSDPQGTVYSDTTFDGFGRVWKQSNPYRTGNDITTTTGTTVFSYDAIGRNLTTTYPDNSVLTTAYCGPSTLVTDPTQRWRRSRTDGLGFLVEVDEPNAVGASVNACPGTGEPIWVTSYGYDTLGNLTSVLQNGSHSRSFTHDALSRMLTSNNPEAGTITYSYDGNGNVSTKTDGRTLTTTYGYDVLNRPLSRGYSNNDPSVSVTYDQSNCLDLSACQNVGQRTSMTDAAGSEFWAYQVDSGHFRSIHEEKRTTNGITKPSTYYLDLAGNVTQATYPTGRVVNYSYDNANRPSIAVDGSNGITYETDWTAPPSSTNCTPTAACYTPQGTFYALSIGQTSSFTGLNLTHIYNSRLQPQEFKASSAGGNAIDITYNFIDSVSGHNASHLYGINNNLDTTRSQNFTYDQLNRITSALTTSTFATSPAHCWAENYTVDAWGNLNSIVATGNSAYNGCSQESGFSTTADGNNQLPIFGYDPSGNTTSDGFVTNYQWDAESQLKSAAGVTYTYDGDGRRIAKVGSKLYWYGSGGDILAETDASGNTTAEYIFFGGKRVAELANSTQGSPGTGSVTISGSEQSISGAAATSGAGSVTFSGTLQSKQVQTQAAASGSGSVTFSGTLQNTQVQTQSATAGTGSVTISGSDRSYTFDPCAPQQSCPQTIWDGGTIAVTVNGVQAGSTTYGQNTTSSLATALASSINGNSSSPVTASASGSTVNLTAKTTGASTNYSLSASSVTNNTQYFSGTSFPVSTSGSTLTGGQNAAYTTVYDSGTCTVTVNSHGDSTSWSGSGTTTSSIASGLASSINGDGSAFVTGSASGSTVSLTAKATGAATNYSLSSSCSYDTSHFSSPSFSTSNSGSALTGGRDATYNTLYDSGTSTITVNGHADTVNWSGSATTASSIASSMATAINADSGASVTASASGPAVNLTAKTTGASTNYSLSSSSTYDSTDFSSPSFSSSNSGSALTGGNDAGATTYDSGNVWITINGTQYSVSYGQGSSSSSVASALASAISAGSLASASANGATVSLTAKTNGYATNYSLSSGSSTSQPGSFSSPSFTASSSGSTLTGGIDGIFYYVEDLLGTSRVLTTDTGVVCYDADFYPYGGEWAYTNTCPQNYKFEGKERDTETGNDDFGARYYSNRFGRWLSADWSAVPAPVPYANLTNPQTLNLYSMVADDPESFADLEGHCPPCVQELEELADTPEGQWVIDHTIGIVVAGAAAGYAASKGWFDKAADFLLTNVSDPQLQPYINLGRAIGEQKAQPIQSADKPGTLGKPDHQQTVKEEAAKYPNGQTEVKVDTPGGEKGSRRIDAANVENGKVTDATQVIRPNKSGTPPAREVRAANDIEKVTGVKPKFVPVRPRIPKPRQENAPAPEL